MTLKEIAIDLWPGWLMGILMITLVLRSSYAYLLRIEKKAVCGWAKFLGITTIFRILLITIFYSQMVKSFQTVASIPILATLFTPWEDACHGLALAILAAMWPNKWFKPIRILAFAIIMIAFGLGHIYQGVGSAFLLAFYVPLSIKMGKKYGFGTVMIGHIMYDFVTLFVIKMFLLFH